MLLLMHTIAHTTKDLEKKENRKGTRASRTKAPRPQCTKAPTHQDIKTKIHEDTKVLILHTNTPKANMSKDV